jgi:hypothetical protein
VQDRLADVMAAVHHPEPVDGVHHVVGTEPLQVIRPRQEQVLHLPVPRPKEHKLGRACGPTSGGFDVADETRHGREARVLDHLDGCPGHGHRADHGPLTRPLTTRRAAGGRPLLDHCVPQHSVGCSGEMSTPSTDAAPRCCNNRV